MPVQNSNSKFSARPDLDTKQLQLLILTTFNTVDNCVKKGNLHFSYVL